MPDAFLAASPSHVDSPYATHTVFNQPPPFEGANLFTADRPLAEALRREGAAWAEDRVRAFGEIAGRRETIGWGYQANEHPPALRTHDRRGERIDEVEFHPAWHALLQLGVEHGLHALPWREPRPGAHVARAAMFLLLAEAEAGVGCPLSMTYSVVPALRTQRELAAEWEPRFTSTVYDPRLVPPGEKAGALCGMAMTEKQGGSDVRANTTSARPIGAGGPGAEYEITGHKWFCSAPMCDAFLVLAQAPGGLSCFLLPRFTPDGSRNRFHLQRLKDKLGNRSNASSEVELRAAWARLVGEEGRGVQTILEMVNHTRLDCVIGSAAGMRWGTARAIHHAAHRRAFGKLLIDQPLMRNVLADLAVESEAATTAMMRLARTYDSEADAPFRRLATAVLKYWTCKRAPVHAAEALECLGGNGYVEEWGMARLYREAPLNSIWEGSGNVQCLDALRAIQKSPESLAALFVEIDGARGGDTRLDSFARELRTEMSEAGDLETRARRLVERLALALQASLLVRHAPSAVAEAFCASRLGGDGGRAFGTLPGGTDFRGILEWALPL
ncbi:MAG TPA: acyl-CoA dehydrogenase family protein [Thermoanaerobaculia bacterium]|jgi:putative acyl-CoA dehydrogenase|nr:acyl-CoA dehydrogenase family protein [Thermoanaerobaculia bacterium]